MPTQIQKLFVSGSTGKLEVVHGQPASEPRGIAIIAHPHPLHGGTMENKVVHTMFSTLLALDFITAKFNFRGVGLSEGKYDHGVGETDDAITVAKFIHQQFNHQNSPLPLLLAGFSFGGAIQLHAALTLNPDYLILVAPSVAHLQAPAVPKTTQLALIIQGDKDDIVSPETILDWATPTSQPIVFIPGAEHFFHGKLMVLKDIINQSFRKI